MQSLKDQETAPPSELAHMDEGPENGRSGVIGNERLTALAGVALLVLILIELVTAANLHAFQTVHIFVGILLTGPLVVKLGSTGYRFVRYYTKSPAYVRNGPPVLPLRILGPLLIITTLVVVGSGIGLVVAGPARAGLLRPLHSGSVAIWLTMLAIHASAYLLRALRLIMGDWRRRSSQQAPGRGIRLGVTFGALLAGGCAAILLLPGAAPWVVFNQAGYRISGTLIGGLVIAALVVVVLRPFKWK
jgi:hypothetical protein